MRLKILLSRKHIFLTNWIDRMKLMKLTMKLIINNWLKIPIIKASITLAFGMFNQR